MADTITKSHCQGSITPGSLLLWSYGKCPGEPCRMLHINTSRHLLADKQPGYKYFSLWNRYGAASSWRTICGCRCCVETVSGNKCSVLGNLDFLKEQHNTERYIKASSYIIHHSAGGGIKGIYNLGTYTDSLSCFKSSMGRMIPVSCVEGKYEDTAKRR